MLSTQVFDANGREIRAGMWATFANPGFSPTPVIVLDVASPGSGTSTGRVVVALNSPAGARYTLEAPSRGAPIRQITLR